MRWPTLTAWRTRRWRAFTLPELLVVIGIIALLLSITAPTIQLARRQAQQAKCGSNLKQLGVALESLRNSYDGFYPLWDDNSGPTRHTWIDVLVQTRFMGNCDAGYCPADSKPECVNQARAQFYGLIYPGGGTAPGVDYSYGIGVPLSAGGWKWEPRFSPDDPLRREFFDHERYPSQTLLAADASWTSIYNMSGDYLLTGIWNFPTQFDNTISWARHPKCKANLLMQDCHVAAVQYQVRAAVPIDTVKYCVWYPGESKNVNPGYEDPKHPGNGYPNIPPIDWDDKSDGGPSVFPNDLNPHYYTVHRIWTQIRHK
jgi:prepilin-type N-terminal cleavage/methylation domain-containing protein